MSTFSENAGHKKNYEQRPLSLKDEVRNVEILDSPKSDYKLAENRLRCYDHIMRRPVFETKCLSVAINRGTK